MPSALTAPPWSAHLEQAFAWLCHARREASPHHGVWRLRDKWDHVKAQLTEELANRTFRFSSVKLTRTATGDLMECWEAQDSLFLKALTLHLQPTLSRKLSPSCYHLQGRGGVKGSIQQIRDWITCDPPHFVARSDAKGYYANIGHSSLFRVLGDLGVDPPLITLISHYCRRLVTRDGYYAEQKKSISMGCPLSPLMAAVYLSPLDEAMAKLPGIRYLRYMDDWVIFAESRWKLRRAIRVMNQVLSSLGLEQHPNKTSIGRLERGFDFLGVQFTATGEMSPSAVSNARHTEKTARLYEQGASLERIERYRQNWLRYLRVILGKEHPATKMNAGHTPHPSQMHASVLSSHHPSHRDRFSISGAKNENRNDDYEKTKQIRKLPRRDRWGRMCRECS